MGDLDLRTRENGFIKIHSDVTFDKDVRLVAARNGSIIIKEGAELGNDVIVNAGEKVEIGKNVLIGPRCIIQASNHGTDKIGDIKGQRYNHKPIKIQRGAWLSANVVVLPGVNIGNGAVIGASSVVTKDVPDETIAVGIPSRILKNKG